jgi:para-aminobenzoate synthetase/4-amino-4-deoxychorismate lyase
VKRATSITPPFALLHDARPGHGAARLWTAESGARVIRADAPEAVPEALSALEQALDAGYRAAGFLSYELGYLFEPRLMPLLPHARRLPLLWFLIGAPRALAADETPALLRQAEEEAPAVLEDLRPGLSAAQHAAALERIQRYIAAGDIYQANFTFPLHFRWRGAPLALMARLLRRQPVAHAACLRDADIAIVSASPETFIEVHGDTIRTLPMKGTARRHADAARDAALARALQRDAKNRAENLMITDMARNDLGRVCRVGSVRAPRLFAIESWPTVHQMVSEVTGTLRKDVRLNDLLAALFPAASITGAPKIRAMEIIHELEEEPRGVYCGAIGELWRDEKTDLPQARFSVAIRTLELALDGTGRCGIGSGIVADSRSREEYEECLLKARFLRAAMTACN